MQKQQAVIEGQQATINALKAQLDAQNIQHQKITAALQTAGIGVEGK